jgi:hypothetical protein
MRREGDSGPLCGGAGGGEARPEGQFVAWRQSGTEMQRKDFSWGTREGD